MNSAPDRSDGAGGDAAVPPLPPLPRPLRVLVADDGRVDRRIVSAILERRGHTVTAVDDGAKALARLKEAEELLSPFDAAVLDLHMPAMDGCEVVTWIRAYEETEKKETPILLVALSGATSESDWWRGKGVNHFLTKPVDPLLLIATLEGWDPRLAAPAAAAPDADAEKVVFDLGEALTRARGKRALLAELIQIFLEDASQQMEVLQAAIVAGDLDRIERAAHRLKGSALNVSAQRVAAVAEKMEMRVRAGQAGAALGLRGNLEAEVASARKAFAGFLAQNSPPGGPAPAAPSFASPASPATPASAPAPAEAPPAPAPAADSAGDPPSSVPSFLLNPDLLP